MAFLYLITILRSRFEFKTARLLSESIDYIEIEDFIRPVFEKNSRVKLRISFEKIQRE